jgi:hypothetical protein
MTAEHRSEHRADDLERHETYRDGSPLPEGVLAWGITVDGFRFVELDEAVVPCRVNLREWLTGTWAGSMTEL